MTWIDISQPLYNGMPVWPGDTPFSFQLTMKKAENGVVNVGQICCSTHCGTHADAPYHYDDTGNQIHELDLDLYIGEAQVVCVPNKEIIRARDIEKAGVKEGNRLLIRTDSVTHPSVFPDSYTYLHPEVGEVLAEKGIRLLGLDVPSVDFKESKTLDAHHSLNRYGIHILENLVLGEVTEGIYDFIALPLPIRGADGCPVRAVVRKKTLG